MIIILKILYKWYHTKELQKSALNKPTFIYFKYSIIEYATSLPERAAQATVPFAPATNSKGNSYLLPPIWKREYRAPYMASKKQKEQDKIAMKWKYHSKSN